MKSNEDEQRKVCERWGAAYLPTNLSQKVGISDNILEGIYPINGLRHLPIGDTSGWYIWAGERMSLDDDFFKPLHTVHLTEWCPEIEKYLGLAPGWRFLVALKYEDVWFDGDLLKE